MVVTTSGALGVPLEFVEEMEHLEAQVKLFSERQNITSAPTSMTYHSSFTMEIHMAALPEAFTMPQIP